MNQLSNHLTLEKFTASETAQVRHIDNTMPDELMGNAVALATNLFEPVRALLGVPLHVDSGYRCEALNMAVRGVSTSQHTKGQAIDIIPEGLDIHDAFQTIKSSNLVWDQIILEHSGNGNIWIHLSYSTEHNRQMVISNLLKPT